MDADNLPTVEKLLSAQEVLRWLSERAAALPENLDNGLEMSLHLLNACSYVVAYTKHLAQGLEPYDALLATAQVGLKASWLDASRAIWPTEPGDSGTDHAK